MKDTRDRTAYDKQPINPDMKEGRYQDALRRIRESIAKSEKIEFGDDTCSWGMCSDFIPEHWPDPNDHVFPVDFLRSGRISPRHHPHPMTCPMERPEKTFYDGWPANGCFYRCDIFSPLRKKGQKEYPLPTKEEVLARFDKTIAEREAKYGKKTTADDQEHWTYPNVKSKRH